MLMLRLNLLLFWSKELMIYGIYHNMYIMIGKEQSIAQQLYKSWFSTKCLSYVCWQIQIPFCQLSTTYRLYYQKNYHIVAFYQWKTVCFKQGPVSHPLWNKKIYLKTCLYYEFFLKPPGNLIADSTEWFVLMHSIILKFPLL